MSTVPHASLPENGMNNAIDTIKNGVARFVTHVWQFFVGGVVVLAAFAGNFVDLKQSRISVEITGINQSASAEVDIARMPGFTNFKKLAGLPMLLERDKGFNVEAMKQELERFRQNLVERRGEYSKLREKATTLLEQPEAPAKSPTESGENTVFDFPSALLRDEQILKLPRDKLKERLAEDEALLRSQESTLALAETEVAQFAERAAKSDSKIEVTAAISNSGDGSTSLKPQALLRADLGQGNYLDIYLRITRYETGVAELRPRGTSVLIFESPPINRMAPADQERFANFFRNTSPTNLYVVDVRNRYYRSNTIPFAQGIYEQKIYDAIKNYATRANE